MHQMDMSGKLGFEDYKQLWSDLLLCKVSCVQGCGLGLDVSVSRCIVSSQQKLSMSRPCLGVGHLRLMPEASFQPNCAGQNNKMGQFTLGMPSSFHL